MRLGDHVADLVHGAADEIHELKLGYRPHSGERGAERRAHNGGFGDGSVNHALGAEAVDEAVGDLKGSAVDADVLADAENGRIALHLFPNSLTDGFQISKLRHGLREFTPFATPR